MYIEEQPEIPFTALKVLVAEINYGGRVTDNKDMRLIKALLSKYFCPDVMTPKYCFSPSELYYSPNNLILEEVKSYISNLPGDDDPEVIFSLKKLREKIYLYKKSDNKKIIIKLK